ncbi:hypothetical protein P692DRAFT_20644775, partial [Suillus brevipes Sb2]
YTLNHIISVLLQITQISGSTPLPVTTAIRSVVFLLKQHVVDEISDAAACQISTTVAQQVTDSVATKLVDHHIMTAINPQIDQLTTTSNSLTSSLENASKIHQMIGESIDLDRDITAAATRITNATDTIYSAIEDCHNAIDRLSPSLETTQDQIRLLSMQLMDQEDHQLFPPTPAPMDPTPTTYSNIATTLLSNRPMNTQNKIPPVDEALARSAIRARQILLDPIAGNSTLPPEISHHD